jgi:ketosteroid isomerase-like protein
MGQREARSVDGEANRRVLERMFHALAAQDWDGVVTDIAEDFVQDWPQSGERITGRQHCLAIYRNYPGGSPRLTPWRITGGGDAWTVESRMRYGDKPVDGIHIFEFRDGRIVRETDYWADPFDPPAWRSEWVTIVD